jgi:minichromosome maintenance protein 10
VQQAASDPDPAAAVVRTASFTDQAIVKRDENLAIIDDFEPGPYNHAPPSDDPEFEKLEPHSNIALKSRLIPHDDFKEHLSGRYFLSPSQLYSCIRLQPDKQHYDIPVPGDWVTIAVVAERGPIKYTRAPVALEPDELQKKKKDDKGKKKEEQKPTGKKYTNMKLIDFGARAKSSATGSKAVVRGDAFLSLLLFEADTVEFVDKVDGRKPEKVYKGGSRGAFEALEKLKEGDVIALLNPRILKPYQVNYHSIYFLQPSLSCSSLRNRQTNPTQ